MQRRKLMLGLLGLASGSGLAGAYLASRQQLSSVSPRPIPSAQATGSSPTSPSPTPVPTATGVAHPDAPNGLFIPPRRDLRLLVISDMNAVYGSVEYDPEVDRGIGLIPYFQPDIVLGGGDMVAGQDPRLSEERIRAMWAAFDRHVAGPIRAAKLPYGFTLGNHDASCARSTRGGFLFQKERDLAREFWNDPAHDPGLTFVDRGDFPFYYTFEKDDVFYLAWDATCNFIPPEQMAWAEAALASERAQAAKLRIVIGHLPLYAITVGRNDPGEVLLEADAKRALLEKYRVHTYISGHHHGYYPGHKGKLQLLHCGILGSGPRPLLDSPLPPRKTITLVDIDFATPDITHYTTYDMRDLSVVDQAELPRFITGHNGLVLRRDVNWDALSPEEIATCQSRIGSLCRD
ncbi:MAG: metallophosphoesterase family protein [Cyanobacteriota bacterium]